MVDYDGLTPGQVLADASVAEFIKTLGLGIAEAQKALDDNSVDQIAEFIKPIEIKGNKTTLLDLGLSPAFYHYQHADITCSLQLSLRVEKNLSLGLNLSGSYDSTSSDSGSQSETETYTETGDKVYTATREASVDITAASAGTLTVGGENFQLSGDTPRERIRNLQNALTSTGSSGIARVLYQITPSPLTISTDDTSGKVAVSPNTVAFLSGGFDCGIIRIGTNADTTYDLDDAPTAKSATTTAQASLPEYAQHVKTQVEAEGYTTKLFAPDAPVATALFETDKHDIALDDWPNLMSIAKVISTLSINITIEGFADRQRYANVSQEDSDKYNKILGDNRANELKGYLIAFGVAESQITITPSRGEAAAADAGDEVNQDNQAFRKAEIKTVGRSHHWLLVKSSGSEPNLNNISRDKIGDSSDANGFIFLFQPQPLNLSGKKATIEGTDFPFSGTEIGSHAAESPQAYAKNLANAINGNSAAGLQASAEANVVTVAKNGDKFKLTLVTASSRNISISGRSGITVTSQFTRSSSSSMTKQNTGNRTVAVGASLDVRYSRQFEMNVTGNSSISARLVSIPAPPQFLETIKEYMREE